MRTVFIAGLLLMAAAPALALEGEWQGADHIQMRLLSAAGSIGPGQELEAALQVKLEEGWHTYWRSPGDSGLAPELDWSASANLQGIDPAWPVPARFDEYGIQTFGYRGEVTFPLSVTLEEPGRETVLAVQGAFLVCKEICIPQQLSASLTVPAGDGAPGAAQRVIDFARTKTPYKEDRPGLKIENVTAGPEAVVVNAFSQKGYMSADLFVELPGGALATRPKITVDAQDQRRAQIVVAAPANIENFFDLVKGQTIILTLTNGQEAVERKIEF